jgi:hypothetical protein
VESFNTFYYKLKGMLQLNSCSGKPQNCNYAKNSLNSERIRNENPTELNNANSLKDSQALQKQISRLENENERLANRIIELRQLIDRVALEHQRENKRRDSQSVRIT